MGDFSGGVNVPDSIGKFTVTGSVVGSDIRAGTTIKSLTIGGSLTRGLDGDGGAYADTLGTILIGGDVVGGYLIASAGAISSITINGSILPAAAASFSAFIAAATILNSLTIKGSVMGLENGTASTPMVVLAGGNGGPIFAGSLAGDGKTDLAIKSISIGGDVFLANILAGYDLSNDFAIRVASDRHAQIGSISIAGNWTASNIVAGAMNTASNNANFGDANDASIRARGATDISAADTSSTLSSIASIKIGGTVAGTPDGDNSTDHFGFVAQQIGALSVNGVGIALTPGPSNDNIPLGTTGDFNLHEVT